MVNELQHELPEQYSSRTVAIAIRLGRSIGLRGNLGHLCQIEVPIQWTSTVDLSQPVAVGMLYSKFFNSRLEAFGVSLMLRSCPVGSVSAAARKASVPATLTLAFGLAFFTLSCAGWAEALHCKSSPVAGLDWSHCNKSRLMLDGSELESANLFSTDFSFTDLRDANLKSANLEKATLVRAWLTGANAVKANFARIEAYRANFAEVSAEGASFASAELQRVDFSRARLTEANFEKTELGRANFDEAVFRNTRFFFVRQSFTRRFQQRNYPPLGSNRHQTGTRDVVATTAWRARL